MPKKPSMNPNETHAQIIVSLYDGGGVEVALQNYRPMAIHCRVLETDRTAEMVSDVVRGLVKEWVADQKKNKKIRVL